MILTDHERKRFCEYLRQQIRDGEAVLAQFEKLPYGEPLIKRERTRILGWTIVLEDLESMESFSIGGGE